MLRYLTGGESHGPQLTAIIDGLPAGLPLDLNEINHQLLRRQKGYGRGERMKIEQDQVRVVSGVRFGCTMGGPVTLIIVNQDWENWSEIMEPFKPVPENLKLKEKPSAFRTTCPRPGHADLPGGVKWNHHDLRNVLERASARETAARVALGAIARQLLEHFDVRFASHVVRIGQTALAADYDISDLERIVQLSEASVIHCIDSVTERAMITEIKAAKKSGDSLGGVVELIMRGLPIGLGGFSQWDQRLDGRLAASLMSIPSVKGIEIGIGFKAAERRGSQVHDKIYYDPDTHPTRKGFFRKSNNAGGLEGGLTNGEDIVVRVAGKPLSTLIQPLPSVDIETRKPATATVERTDVCIIPALAVVCEAVAALVLADAFLDKFGSDNLAETERNYQAFLATPY